MNPITYFPAKRRVQRRQKTLAPAANPLPPLNITMIDDVNYDDVNHKLYVTAAFDTTEDNPLTDIAAASPGKWSAQFNGERFAATGFVQLAYNLLQIEMAYQADGPVETELVYTNNPSDIRDASGRKLAALVMPL